MTCNLHKASEYGAPTSHHGADLTTGDLHHPPLIYVSLPIILSGISSRARQYPSPMGSSSGSTLGLDFSKGRVFSDEVFRSTGHTIHPWGRRRAFTLIVSFSRHAFRLSEDSVAVALEAAVGGSEIDLGVNHLKDKV